MPMGRKALLGLCMAALLAVTVIAGCADGNKPLSVQVGEVTRSLFYAPLYVALENGFFEQEGLEVSLRTTWGGDTTMTTLLSGGIDVALVGAETSVYVYQQGADDPVINFAQLTQTDGTFLMARTPPDGAFDWEELKGSVFLGQRVGGMPQMAGEYTMKQKGIDPHADMQLIQNVDFANIPAAFAAGTGDYVQLFEPQATMMELEGVGHVVASFGAEGGHLPYTAFMSKQSFIADHPERIQKFTDAVYRAQLWVAEQPVAVIAAAVAPYFEDTEPQVIEQVIERYKSQGSYASDPVIDEAEWERLLDVMQEAGEITARVPRAELVDHSFAAAAAAGR